MILSAPAERYGASTRQVLRDLGHVEERIDEMIAAGAIGESWSKDYLPSQDRRRAPAVQGKVSAFGQPICRSPQAGGTIPFA